MTIRKPPTRPLRERAVRPAAAAASGQDQNSTATGDGQRPVRRTRETVAGAAVRRPTPGPSVRTAPESHSTPPSRTARGAGEAKAGGRTGNILFVTHELSALLRRENKALAEHSFSPVKEGLERKQALARAYMEQIVAITRNPALVQDLPEEDRQALRKAGSELDELMQENARRLKANIEASERLLASVVNAAREKDETTAPCYRDSARKEGLRGGRRRALALNEEL